MYENIRVPPLGLDPPPPPRSMHVNTLNSGATGIKFDPHLWRGTISWLYCTLPGTTDFD